MSKLKSAATKLKAFALKAIMVLGVFTAVSLAVSFFGPVEIDLGTLEITLKGG